ncbi:MAG: hypothetical protein QOI86_3637 [Actinomycetota bacterium]|nr:hypothetical protein [Actinomycetota bacterium]
MTPTVVGRDAEIQILEELLERVRNGGACMVIRGDAGVGKSTLLLAAKDRARARGMLVLSTTGVESEAHLPFAGLHQLLRPVLAGAAKLPDPQRLALLGAFGMADGASPDLFLIALASLNLLADSASSAPLLLGAEDAQWLDRSSGEVLAFIARRLESDPIVLLFCLREGCESGLDDAGLVEMCLEGLDRAAAGLLLERHAPGLAPPVREQLLDQAAGNPLALVELPLTVGAGQLAQEAERSAPLPLTARLERAFAARVAGLPAASRAALLVAAADDRTDIAALLSATRIAYGKLVSEEALAQAISARLIEVDGPHLRFRHPLVRSAVYQMATPAHRRRAHEAIAEVLHDDPDRGAWHRAASVLGPDEDIAGELEAAAGRARRRGALASAVLAFERAASLTQDPDRRGRRLVEGAELAFELGRRDLVARLLREAGPLVRDTLGRARVTWVEQLMEPRVYRDPSRLGALITLAEQTTTEGDPDLALELLWLVAQRSFWGNQGSEIRERLVAAAEQAGSIDRDPRVLAIVVYSDPANHDQAVVDRLRTVWNVADHALAIRYLGNAATVLGAFDVAEEFLAASALALREQGRLGHLARVLCLQAWAATFHGDWKVALPAAEEAGRLAVETREPVWAAGSKVVTAMVAAQRGEADVAEQLASEAEQAMLPVGVSFILACVQMTRGAAALTSGRHLEAYEHLTRLFDPKDPAHHPPLNAWAIGDLVEAAVHSGQTTDVRTLIDSTPELHRSASPWIRANMRYAEALLATNADVESRFESALGPELTRWPLLRGRVLLGYGTWLRRQRRVAESRRPLRAAGEVFDALGVTPWAERARSELRAAGESTVRRAPQAWNSLTSQELQIAELAADGLSNREIGVRLYLSHRTVGAHLYRIFPKLGITSRHELQVALGDRVM